MGEVKELFSGSNLSKQLCTMVLLSCSIQLYFMCLYNSSELKGNHLKMIMVFAIAEASGVLVSSQLIKLMSIPKAIFVSVFLMIVLNAIIKFGGYDESIVLLLFLGEASILGAYFNLAVLT